jgi:hypothetical protein
MLSTSSRVLDILYPAAKFANRERGASLYLSG